MRKEAPDWGKAIGIIMITLGSLGIFYQAYKIIFFNLMRSIPSNIFDNLAHSNPNLRPEQEMVLNGMGDMMRVNDESAKWVMLFGILGVILMIFYIVGGAKLLTPKPANYNFAKYILIVLIAYNVIEGVVFIAGDSGYLVDAIMTYSGIGLALDIALLIILLASNKSSYGIGVDTEMQQYTLDREDEEII